MPQDYPYTISNRQIEPFLAQIRSAAKPERITLQFLKKLGFTASNDRALPRILKNLGFLSENGTPTEDYDRLRDKTDWQYVLGEQIRDLYADLYSINTEIHNAPDDEIKGAISRVTGQDGKSVNRYFSTFKALAALAKFNGKTKTPAERKEPLDQPPAAKPKIVSTDEIHRDTQFHYNIQIHLPATTDIAVYNAIFKSLKDSLFV